MALQDVLLLAVAAITVVALAVLGLLYLRDRREDRDPDAERLASVELHRIGTRLNVARARAEIHRDALTFKDWLREELNDRRP